MSEVVTGIVALGVLILFFSNRNRTRLCHGRHGLRGIYLPGELSCGFESPGQGFFRYLYLLRFHRNTALCPHGPDYFQLQHRQAAVRRLPQVSRSYTGWSGHDHGGGCHPLQGHVRLHNGDCGYFLGNRHSGNGPVQFDDKKLSTGVVASVGTLRGVDPPERCAD